MKRALLISSVVLLAGLAVIGSALTPKHIPAPVTPPQKFGGTGPTYFAELDPTTKVVLRVIVADQAFIDSGRVGNPANWLQTSMDGSLHKNYAGKGYNYSNSLDAFVPPKPTSDAVFSSTTATWSLPPQIQSVTATSTL